MSRLALFSRIGPRERARARIWVCAVAGALGSVIQTDASLFRSRAGIANALLWAVLLATLAWLVATTLARLRRVNGAATVIAAWLVVVYAVADRAHAMIFGHHIDRANIMIAPSAFRTGAVPIGAADLAILGVALAVLAALIAGLELLFTRAPRLPSVIRAIGAAVAAGAFGVVLFRDLLFTPGEGTAPFFWHRPPADREKEQSGPGTSFRVGSALVDVQAAELSAIAGGALAVSVDAPKDILFVHVESLRFDMLNSANMPKLDGWRSRCWSSDHHYSTSNNTGGGAFGVMSGLSGYYYPAARKNRFGSLPLLALSKLGYERHVWFANEALRIDDALEVLFGDRALAHTLPGEPTHRADRAVVDAYLAAISAPPRSPHRFDYVVLDSSHYDYSYPPDFEKFTPSDTLGVATKNGVFQVSLTAAQTTEFRRTKGAAVWNRYKNSVLYVDTLVDELLRGLERAGRLQTTIVAVFGDHGEAFWERGSFGHSTQMTDEQTRTPFLLCPAPAVPLRYAYTSHADIFPTLFDLMHVRVDRPFMTGKSLATFDASRDLAIVRSAVIGDINDPRHTIVMGGAKLAFDDGEPPKVLWVRDGHDEPLANPPADLVTKMTGAAVAAKLLH